MLLFHTNSPRIHVQHAHLLTAKLPVAAASNSDTANACPSASPSNLSNSDDFSSASEASASVLLDSDSVPGLIGQRSLYASDGDEKEGVVSGPWLYAGQHGQLGFDIFESGTLEGGLKIRWCT